MILVISFVHVQNTGPQQDMSTYNNQISIELVGIFMVPMRSFLIMVQEQEF